MTGTERKLHNKGLKRSTPYGTYEADRIAIHTWANSLDISDSMMLQLMVHAGREDVTVTSAIKQIKAKAAKEGVHPKKIIESL